MATKTIEIISIPTKGEDFTKGHLLAINDGNSDYWNDNLLNNTNGSISYKLNLKVLPNDGNVKLAKEHTMFESLVGSSNCNDVLTSPIFMGMLM